MDTVGLDHDIDLVEAAPGHEEITEINLYVVHSTGERKGMRSPRLPVRDAVDHNRRRAEIKKER